MQVLTPDKPSSQKYPNLQNNIIRATVLEEVSVTEAITEGEKWIHIVYYLICLTLYDLIKMFQKNTGKITFNST